MEKYFNATPPPILLTMFNRPHKAIQVFEKIRQVRPPKLFLAVNAPRPNYPGEEEKVQQCRDFANLVDWDCDLKCKFAETHMKLTDSVPSAINWAFEHVDELIILDDDAVPDLSFFRFCRELLEKYRDDNRVFTIGGFNIDGLETFDESYGFSKHFYCWSWATWKRAWKNFDITMKHWPTFKQNKYMQNIFRKHDRLHLTNEFQMTYEGKIDTWDYNWYLNCLANHALHIVPKVNLVRNTGFELGAHTDYPVLVHSYMDEAMDFPLVHPEIMSPLNRLFVPPKLSPEELERRLSEYDAAFRRILQAGNYRDVLTLFKQVLRERISGKFLTWYHLNFCYYVALAYFKLGDFEHAEAMTDIILVFTPQNVDLVLFRIQVFIRQGAFDKVQRAVETLTTLNPSNFTPQQTAMLTEILNSIETNRR